MHCNEKLLPRRGVAISETRLGSSAWLILAQAQAKSKGVKKESPDGEDTKPKVKPAPKKKVRPRLLRLRGGG